MARWITRGPRLSILFFRDYYSYTTLFTHYTHRHPHRYDALHPRELSRKAEAPPQRRRRGQGNVYTPGYMNTVHRCMQSFVLWRSGCCGCTCILEYVYAYFSAGYLPLTCCRLFDVVALRWTVFFFVQMMMKYLSLAVSFLILVFTTFYWIVFERHFACAVFISFPPKTSTTLKLCPLRILHILSFSFFEHKTISVAT